jgi:hypothetical protein
MWMRKGVDRSEAMASIRFVSLLVVIANFMVILFSAYLFIRITIIDFIDWHRETRRPTQAEGSAIVIKKYF